LLDFKVALSGPRIFKLLYLCGNQLISYLS
jgi:hypothetical protein